MPLEKENLTRVVEILKQLGRVYLSKNQYREAAEKFEDILRLGVKDSELYCHLAVALSGQKIYTPEALRVYDWAVEKFPQDRSVCLHVSLAALHHNAEDEQAQRFYEAALKFHPPFAKDLYLHLHAIFHRRKKYDESFQTLKQALYLERSGEDQLVTRLTQLGWRYDRQQELIMTLQFLLGNNETNQTIRRCLAFSLAHTIIRHHCKRKPSEVNLPYGSEADLQMLQSALPNSAALTTLSAVQDYCTLQLALLVAPKPAKSLLSAAPFKQQNESYAASAPRAFEYRSLLNAQPLEEILASPSSLSTQTEISPTPSNNENAAFDWHKDLLNFLPAGIETGNHGAEQLTASAATDGTKSNHQNALLILSPTFFQDKSDPKEASSLAADLPVQKAIELITQHLAAESSAIRVHALRDGIMAFSSHADDLAQATIALFKKIARYNVLAPEKNQFILQAALHTLSPAQAFSSSQKSSDEDNLAGVELLYDTLHLLKAEREEQGQTRGASPAACSRLLMSRQVFDSVMDTESFTVKYWGTAYWGAPGWHDEVCEMVWHNPLDYAEEKKPYALGRFLVMEKFHEQRAYGTFRTRDRSLERPVVLKALHPEVYLRRSDDQSQQAEMVNAIRRLGRLEHPGVALIYDMGTHEDIFYFVREHIEGENLAQTLASQQYLSPVEAVRLLIEVCRILRYTHKTGFYHGNLKPSNIWRLKSVAMKEPTHVRALLAPPASQSETVNSGVKISDFFIPGFNEISEASWYYAAPELHFQNQSNYTKVLGATTDIYALGMILYDCLGGKNPFQSLHFPIEQSLWQQVQLTPLATVNHTTTSAGILTALDEIIQRATHQDPLQRFQAIDEFESALRQALKELLALIHKPMSLMVIEAK
jgi:Tfp pilus assembly protein PilF